MFTQQQDRAQRRQWSGTPQTNPLYQPRNELGNILCPNGIIKPGDGTLPRDLRAHLRGDRPKPKRCRHREWPWSEQN